MAEGPGGHSRRPLSLPPLTFGGLQALGARGLEAAQGPLDHLLVLDLHHLGGVRLVVFGACREDLPCSAARHLPGEPQAQPSPTHHAAEVRGSPSSDPCPSCSRCCPLCPARQPPAPKGPTQSDSPTLHHRKPPTPPSTAKRPPESQDLPSITPQGLQQLPRDPKLPYSFPSRPPDTLGWDKRFLDTPKMSWSPLDPPPS